MVTKVQTIDFNDFAFPICDLSTLPVSLDRGGAPSVERKLKCLVKGSKSSLLKPPLES